MNTPGIYGLVLLETYPSARGFLSRYLLCLTPGILAGFSVLVLTYLMNMLNESSVSIVRSLGKIVPELPAYIEITILLIAPVGIFLFFIFIGDLTNHAEIWVGAALTLLLCAIGAFYQVYTLGIPIMSTQYLLSLFQWTAYLVIPASVIASALLLIGTELFRRSIRYTLYHDMIRITGGVWTPVEHLIAHKQIGRIMVKQNVFNRLIHVGTILFAGAMYHGMNPSMIGTGDTAGTEGLVSGYTLISPDKVYSPLDCLYGIKNPEKAKELLEPKVLHQ